MSDCKEFEWLTEGICKEYLNKAAQLPSDEGDVGEWRKLRIELQKRCNITELQAYNILRGQNIKDYITYYGIISGAIPASPKLKEMQEKNKKKNEVKDKLKEYEDRIADLESLSRYNTSFGFEEKDDL